MTAETVEAPLPLVAHDRIAKLERDVCRLRRLLMVFALIFVVIAGRVALSSRHLVVDLIEARALRIHNAEGKLGIHLTATPCPQVNLFDDNDNIVLNLVQRQGRPEIFLRDGAKEKQLWLNVSEKGPHIGLGNSKFDRIAMFVDNAKPCIALLDEAKYQLTLELSKNGPTARMWDQQGVERMHFGSAHNDDVGIFYGLFLNDAAGMDRMTVNTSRRGPMIAMRDAKEVSRLQVFQRETFQGLELYSKDGVTRSTFGLDQKGPRLELFDEKGNHQWP